MRHILAPSNRRILERFAHSNVLLAFDFDGTLAPIVSRPQRACLRAPTRAWLDQASRLYPCVIITGRARADALGRLDGIRLTQVIGNHGLEPWKANSQASALAGRWHEVLRRELESLQGVEIENKTYSIAVHYRRSPRPRQARFAILAALPRLGPHRLILGKKVVDVLPPIAPHKGEALEEERARLGCDTMIYTGDDETDEDAFALDSPGRALTIRIGKKRGSAARFYLNNQKEIDRLLSVLVALRARAE